MIKKMILLVALLFCFVLCFAGSHDPFDGTGWDIASPDINQPIGNDYKEIYDLRKGIAIRMNKEHETLATGSAGGVHKQGSARMWYLATASIPNLQPDGTTALDSGDNGMLWHDTTTDIIYVLDDYSDPTIGNGWLSFGNFLGDIDVGASKFTVASASGNTVVAGTLGVTGASIFTAGITANGGITLGAGDDLIGSATSDITINTDKFTVAGASGDTVVAGTLAVAGTLGVTGVATLGDTSALATSGAPAADAQIANKKYVDDQCDAHVGTAGQYHADGTTVFNTTVTTANTWQDLDISAQVGSNVALCFFEVTQSGGGGVDVEMKPKGEGGATSAHILIGCAGLNFTGASQYGYITCATDSSGIVQIYASNNSGTVTIKLIGYVA